MADGKVGAPRKVYCKRDHMFTELNTYVDKRGVQHCRACRKMHHKNCLNKKKPKSLGASHA